MEAEHSHLTTRKSFYVGINRARHRAELVTDDRKTLDEHLESAPGERLAALESLEPAAEEARWPAAGHGAGTISRHRQARGPVT